MSSPVSRLFLASSLILARLLLSAKFYESPFCHIPVLEPNLNRPFGHVDFLGNSLTDGGSGCGVVVEFHLQCRQLILCSTLSLLVLLLLSESTLAGRSS